MTDLNFSSRKNSITSLSTMNSVNTNNATNSVRNLSTDNLIVMEDKFMKKSIKKVSNGLSPIQQSPQSSDNFHKTSGGTYYFPNGEIFRPRVTPSKRNRPSKISHSQSSSRNNSLSSQTLHYTPQTASTSEDFIPRSSSLNCINPMPPSTAYLPKAPSINNLKSKNKQNLAKNIRLHKQDTPTNLMLVNNKSSHSLFAHQKLQSNNLVKNNSLVSLTDELLKSSDSNLSSLSNYNLNRSSSNTPTTSIDTTEGNSKISIDPNADNLVNNEDINASTLNDISEESISKTIMFSSPSSNREIYRPPMSSPTSEYPEPNIDNNNEIDMKNEYKEEEDQNQRENGRRQDEDKDKDENCKEYQENHQQVGKNNSNKDEDNDGYQRDKLENRDEKDGNLAIEEQAPFSFQSNHTYNSLENIKNPINSTIITKSSTSTDSGLSDESKESRKEENGSSYQIVDVGKNDKLIDNNPPELSIHTNSPTTSIPTTPKNTKYFDFQTNDAFNRFLNDDQTEVPPRGDLVILNKTKIRKHERASSSISSFNSIIQSNDIDSPRPTSMIPILSPSTNSFKEFKPPSPNKDKLQTSSPNSLNLYSINESGSKISIYSNNSRIHNQKSMLDVVDAKEIKRISSSPVKTNSQNLKLKSPPKVSKSKSMPVLDSGESVKRSSSTSNFKLFWKKIFASNKSSKISSKSEIRSSDNKLSTTPKSGLKSTSSSSSPKKFKKSFSFNNLKLSSPSSLIANKLNEDKKTTINQLPKVIVNEVSGNKSKEVKFPLTNLPIIERDTNIFDDMLTTISKKLTEEELDKPRNTTPKLLNEPFLKDDELTRDQIKDQQIKDKPIEDEFSANLSSSSSEEIYVDDNIRFLQNEFNWSSLDESNLKDKDKDKDKEEQLFSSESTDYSSDTETIIINNKQLFDIFNNLTDYQKKNLPTHLKHVEQFKDLNLLEINIKKFEDLSTVKFIPTTGKNSSSILKKDNSTPTNKKVMFSNKISINETFPPDMYKRYNKSVTQYTLTESYDISKIKNELNDYKCNEMLVHESSQNNTHFFY